MKLIKPFGPEIGEASLADELNQQLLEICLANQNDQSRRANHKLVGLIDKEFDILDQIEKTPIITAMQSAVHEYLGSAISIYREYSPFNKFDTKCSAAWCNIQEVGEYNPIHTHPEEIVCVAYPYANIDTEYKKYNTDGQTSPGNLVFYNQLPDQRFGTNAYTVMPESGKMYIFPGGLPHYTQPFFKEGDKRISVSCNFVLTENFYSLRKIRGYQ